MSETLQLCHHHTPVKFNCGKCNQEKEINKCSDAEEIGIIDLLGMIQSLEVRVQALHEFKLHAIEWDKYHIRKVEALEKERDLGIERIKRLEEITNRITEDDMKAGRKPHKCPACDGKGKLIFMNVSLLTYNPAQYQTKICESCEGKGIV